MVASIPAIKYHMLVVDSGHDRTPDKTAWCYMEPETGSRFKEIHAQTGVFVLELRSGETSSPEAEGKRNQRIQQGDVQAAQRGPVFAGSVR